MPAEPGSEDSGWRHGSDDAAQVDAAAGLIQLSGVVQGAFACIADGHDLTSVQARLLCVLAQSPRGMADLARIFGVEKAALTGLVDRAERRGLAKRAPVPGDRRALRVTLTDVGRRSATAFHAEVAAELNERLTRHDVTQDRLTIRSYLDTARNCGISAITALREAFAGSPWQPPLPATASP